MTAPTLVVGLGGSLAGDDAIGLAIARELALRPLSAEIEALEGGADLLRLGPALLGRRRVVLVDAIEAEPGEADPLVADHPLPGIDARQGHAHQLSAVQALDLLRVLEPDLARVRFTWFLVPVHTVRPSQTLSPELAARLPALVDSVLALL